MADRAHVNIGGSKYRLDEVYTTLINMASERYEQRTQNLGNLATHYEITLEQAFMVKLEADKQRPFMQQFNNNNNEATLERRRGNMDRRVSTRNPQGLARTRTMNKKQYFDEILPQHEQYTMKRSFNAYVKKQYNNTLYQNVNKAVQQVTNVMYRVQLFLTNYVLHYPDNIPAALLSLNGIYSLTQLVRGLPLTSSNRRFPKADIQQHWNNAIENNPELITSYGMNTKLLSDYCQRQSTCINLHLSGNFARRIKSLCRFRFSQLLQEIPNSHMMNDILDLLYNKFAAHTHASNQTLTIPPAIPFELHDTLTQVWTELMDLKPTNMGVLNPRVLAANPGILVPIYIAIINTYDRYNQQEHEQPLRTYSFSILPKPSTNRRFIALLPENLKARTGYQGDIRDVEGPSFLKSYQIYHDVFQFRKFGITSLDDLKSRHETGRLMFYAYILTDGVSINFVFARRPSPSRLDLYGPDFANAENTTDGRFNIVGLDPGRRDIVTTAGGVGTGVYHNRQVSTKEYRTISGVTKRRQDLENRKATTTVLTDQGNPVAMDQLESNLPSLNTANLITMPETIRSRISYFDIASRFYGIEQSRNRFKAYQGQQRSIAATSNIVLNGGKKFRHRIKSKRNKKRRKNKTLKRRTARAERRLRTKADYDTIVGQISGHQRQVDFMNDALLVMQQINAFDTTEQLYNLQSRKVRVEGILESLESDKQKVQKDYIDQYGGSTMKPYKKLRHGSIDTNTTTIPLISFGAGMINTNANHIHGYPVGSTNLVRKHLLERQRRGLCLVGHANEYLTSQICSSCGRRLENVYMENKIIYTLKRCHTCQKTINRDKNAASNMYWILNSSLTGAGRPPSLSR